MPRLLADLRSGFGVGYRSIWHVCARSVCQADATIAETRVNPRARQMRAGRTRPTKVATRRPSRERTAGRGVISRIFARRASESENAAGESPIEIRPYPRLVSAAALTFIRLVCRPGSISRQRRQAMWWLGSELSVVGWPAGTPAGHRRSALENTQPGGRRTALGGSPMTRWRALHRSGFKPRHRAQQRSGIGMQRPGKDLLGRGEFDDLARDT